MADDPGAGPLYRRGDFRRGRVRQDVGVYAPVRAPTLDWQADNPERRAAALVLEVKGDFCHDIRRMLTELDRGGDYIELSLDGRLTWNPLSATWLDAYSLAYTVASLLNQRFGKGKEPFWQQAYTNLVRWIIELYRVLSGGWVTLRDVYHCAIDKDLFARKIKQAQTYAADMSDTWITVAQTAIPDDQIIPLADLGFKPHPTDPALMRGPDTAWITVPLDKVIDHNAELRGMGFSPHPADDALMRGPATETTREYLNNHEIRYTIETTRTYLHSRKIKHKIERHESATVTEIRLRVEAVNRWYVHDWNTLDNKIRSSIMEGVSVFLSTFDLPTVARVFCPPAPQARPARTAGDEGSNPALAATALSGDLPPLDELIEAGRVLALNMPAGTNPALARAIGVMLKNAWLQSLLLRPAKMKNEPGRYVRPAVFICDEYQAFASVGEDDPSGDE